jgi:hypothetical protein
MPKWEQAITPCPQPGCGGLAEAFVEYQYDARGQKVGTDPARYRRSFAAGSVATQRYPEPTPPHEGHRALASPRPALRQEAGSTERHCLAIALGYTVPSPARN